MIPHSSARRSVLFFTTFYQFSLVVSLVDGLYPARIRLYLLRAIIRLGLAHVVFRVTWERSHLMWDGCPVSYSTCTFIHIWIRTLLSFVSPFAQHFWSSSFFSATCSPSCSMQVPNPLLSSASAHVRIVQHMEGDFQRVSDITTLYSNPSGTIMERG